MSCAKISKEMHSMYFGFDVFCILFEARVPEFDTVFVVQCTLYIMYKGGRGCMSDSGTLTGRIQLAQNTMISLC
jgi:hypothetical protein